MIGNRFEKGMIKRLKVLRVDLRRKTKCAVSHKSDLKEIRANLVQMLNAVQEQAFAVKQVNMKVLKVNKEIKSDIIERN